MCDEKHEQQINVKFLIKLKKKLWLSAISRRKRPMMRIFYLVCMSLNGINGFLKAGKAPKMSNVQVNLSVSTPHTVTKINEIVRGDFRMSIWMIAETVNTNKETVKKILHDKLNMKEGCEVGHKKLDTWQLIRQQICLNLLERLDEEPELMENIITSDEIWIFQYDL